MDGWWGYGDTPFPRQHCQLIYVTTTPTQGRDAQVTMAVLDLLHWSWDSHFPVLSPLLLPPCTTHTTRPGVLRVC